MQYYSTNHQASHVPLKEAVLKGLPADNGLFMPETIPQLSAGFFDKISSFSFQEIAFEVSKTLLQDDLPENVLQNIVEDAINFDAPLVQIEENTFCLELFHGPTLAFKDFGARFMSRLMEHLLQDSKVELTILVATSGDTGSAVANGFLSVEGINVIILYPSRKVSEIQEKQLTTLGNNITSLEIEGTFDDCQQLVKQAFLDKELKEKLMLTSANSINIARLIPQSFYYFYAYAQLSKKNNVCVSVPSGNFGNLTAGLIAKKMGLPVSKFIASTNVNDIVPKYLETGLFEPKPSQKTLSNAMDVGNPSNFARMLELYKNDPGKLGQNDVIGFSFDDEQTKATIKSVYEKFNYLLDPHGAIGYLGLSEFRRQETGVRSLNEITGIFMETAHPAKFKDVVEEVIGEKIEIPERLQVCLQKEKQSTLLSNDFDELKDFLL
ncbi:MAG: threonine synthase [Flavobacteriales bacterium]|nr:threonine synthase [Bacteroidales bacterium AH-315-I05]PCJ90041.1 MAG: threonine synthase [Flavobacteriales bacterium]